MIYELAFEAPTGVIGSSDLMCRHDAYHHDHHGPCVCPCAQHRQQCAHYRGQCRQGQWSPLPVAMLRANHQIYHEATPFLYQSKNTILITSIHILEKFSHFPAPLPRCVEENCTPWKGKPRIEIAKFYPAEFNHYLRYGKLTLLTIGTYLPLIGVRGGVQIKNLELDVSLEGSNFRALVGGITYSGIQLLESFTLVAWGFQADLRAWLTSQDCLNTIEYLQLSKSPTTVEETFQSDRLHLDSWKIKWSSKRSLTVQDTNEIPPSRAVADQRATYSSLIALNPNAGRSLQLDQIFPRGEIVRVQVL
jgi:hypothetical protein